MIANHQYFSILMFGILSIGITLVIISQPHDPNLWTLCSMPIILGVLCVFTKRYNTKLAAIAFTALSIIWLPLIIMALVIENSSFLFLSSLLVSIGMIYTVVNTWQKTQKKTTNILNE